MRKIVSLAAVVAGALGVTTAHAAFILQDETAPAQTTAPVPANNDFQAQLAALGVTELTFGTSLAVSAPGQIELTYFGKEATFVNQFLWGNNVVFTTGGPGVDPWGERQTAVRDVTSAGLLDFSFCATNINTCVTNVQNSATTPTSPQQFGIVNAGTTAWLFWDDSGNNNDNDYDDMVVRLRYVAVPEPATLGLFGLGLLGAGFAARRRKS